MLIASIEKTSATELQISLPAAANIDSLDYSLFTFPVIQKAFWEDYISELFNSQNTGKFEIYANDNKQLTTQRLLAEQEENLAIQRITDIRTTLRTDLSSLGDKLTYIHNKNSQHNMNGVVDSEVYVNTLKDIARLQRTTAELTATLSGELTNQAEIRKRIASLTDQQSRLEEEKGSLVTGVLSQVYNQPADLEPLLIPYRIHTISAQTVELQAVTDQVTGPNQIGFHALTPADLAQKFKSGELDAVLSSPDSPELHLDAQPVGTSDVTGILVNPWSEKMLDPIVGQVIACIYTAPDLWVGTSLSETADLQSFQSPPETQAKRRGCSGALRIRLLNMRFLLDKNFYTWDFLKDGSIIAGTMRDPNGVNVSPIVLGIDANAEIPADVQKKLSGALATLGLDIELKSVSANPRSAPDPAVDLLLTSWKTVIPKDSRLCSVSGLVDFPTFPVHNRNLLMSSCGIPQPAMPGIPTASILPSGKPAGEEFLTRTWWIQLSSQGLNNYWNPQSISKYDLKWLLPLSPAWILSW